ncbi:unnamed protein product [Vitrella brassicaformis CCMP3155]|uniref:OsmC-like protein n=1 Tax=Vitrella brassicaformis (strain CCMP3155) TaxID=1169540 RepID=A0A0G4F5G3_VITBC|nr:unnamed protein product [Vitrella brassicaformis CCMP3155]|eukprot:CEM06984.1 unnamed protein product [Vitrella brassicaformis CCMP3155]
MALRLSMRRLALMPFVVKAEGAMSVTCKYTSGKHAQFTDEPAKLGGQDKGPNPLETSLGALCGCLHVLSVGVANEMKMKFDKIDWTAKGELDVKGLKGDPNVQSHFQKVTVEGKIATNESDDRIHELLEKVERRCPLSSLMANVNGMEYVATMTKA